MKELEKAQKKIKEILIAGEINGESFEWLVDQLGLVRVYDKGLPMHIVLGIIKEFTADVEMRTRIKNEHGFNEDTMRYAYSDLESEWNKRN